MPDMSFLMILVIALAAGLVASMSVANHMQSTGSDFYRSYLTNILLFNLLILSGMVFAFMLQGQVDVGFLLPLLLVLMAGLKLGWLLSFRLTLIRLRGAGRDHGGGHHWPVAGVALAMYSLLIGVGWLKSLNTLLEATILALEVLIIGTALVLALGEALSLNKTPAGKLRKAKLQFTLFHAVLMALVLLSLLHGWLTAYQDESDRVLVNGTLLMLFNVFPVWWIRHYRPAEDLAMVEKFERYGISPRERQIVELIALGKTNQAIADELFISLATVKDHNHRIFSKCGVKNRTELARLFRAIRTDL